MNDYGNSTRTRFNATIAVFVAVQNEAGQVLLHQRYHTGYMDGFYDFPSGHLEENELLKDCAVREVSEEVGLEIQPDDLVLLHVNQNNYDRPYINFVFRATSWNGSPTIGEPEKCSDLGFFDLENLPKVTAQVREALSHINDKTVSFSYFTPKDYR